jgi:benzoyl-CoA reductase/2-hydroxyglutaryl-CoA dehydratase subunit BcrC/BadD/HgdB
MNIHPRRLTLKEWDAHYTALCAAGMSEPSYGGPLRRHVDAGDTRLCRLKIDESPAALRLWNFLLSEEDRLHKARSQGKKLVGTMKDLGTVPVMVFSLDELVAFYPDGAWWIPCMMEQKAGLLEIADSMGFDDTFCPVRAVLGAFETEEHFPIPNLLVSSVGATCDDMSAITQQLESMGHLTVWWEMPHRRTPDEDESGVVLPGGAHAPTTLVDFVREELERVRIELTDLAGTNLTDERLEQGIAQANRVREILDQLRETVFTARAAPLPALEMLIAEMLTIHYCSDPIECVIVLEELLQEAKTRASMSVGVLAPEAVGVFWVNPVADLRVMNLLEDAGGRIQGTDYLFTHALDLIPTEVPPMEGLARAALADPMVGSPHERADRICRDMERFGAEALIISRIPGASHCALEGAMIGDAVRHRLDVPVLELEVPSVSDAIEPTLRTRLEALVETVKNSRTGNR